MVELHKVVEGRGGVLVEDESSVEVQWVHFKGILFGTESLQIYQLARGDLVVQFLGREGLKRKDTFNFEVSLLFLYSNILIYLSLLSWIVIFLKYVLVYKMQHYIPVPLIYEITDDTARIDELSQYSNTKLQMSGTSKMVLYSSSWLSYWIRFGCIFRAHTELFIIYNSN